MAEYVCPQCHKKVKDLKGHLARVHPEPLAQEIEKPGAKTLELNVKAKEKSETPGAGEYHCVDCGEALTKGQTPCPGCGSVLDWSALE